MVRQMLTAMAWPMPKPTAVPTMATVFVALGQGKFEPRQVETGMQNDEGDIEIVQGVAAQLGVGGRGLRRRPLFADDQFPIADVDRLALQEVLEGQGTTHRHNQVKFLKSLQ